MTRPDGKSEQAFRTIGELSAELRLPQHILRYWETRFAQLRPLQRAGNRRYYRPDDVALVRRINRLLNEEGYTIRGVQQLLAKGGETPPIDDGGAASPTPGQAIEAAPYPVAALKALRTRLSEALADSVL